MRRRARRCAACSERRPRRTSSREVRERKTQPLGPASVGNARPRKEAHRRIAVSGAELSSLTRAQAECDGCTQGRMLAGTSAAASLPGWSRRTRLCRPRARESPWRSYACPGAEPAVCRDRAHRRLRQLCIDRNEVGGSSGWEKWGPGGWPSSSLRPEAARTRTGPRTEPAERASSPKQDTATQARKGVGRTRGARSNHTSNASALARRVPSAGIRRMSVGS